jgi:trehalose 6-phosphate phosphatase
VTSKPTVLVPALTTPAEVALRDLITADSLLIALDFDGVLAPLQDDPETSRMTAGSRAAIADLARLPHTRVALVSGRDIATLRRLTALPETVWMIGSHGAEANLGPADDQESDAGEYSADIHRQTSDRIRSPELTDAEEKMLAAIDAHIDDFEHDFPGTDDPSDFLVERKPYSRTVHTRGFDPDVAAALHEHATQVAEEFPDIRVIEGHDITELAVKQATKGDGLRLLARAGQPTAMAYLGDDVTDEDAFSALEDLTESPDSTRRALEAGLSVKVGTAPTRAHWRITGPDAVADLLTRLAAERAAHLGVDRS